MAIFAWSDEYSVGVLHIDAQHKQLFSLVEQLHEAMSLGKGNEAMEKVLTSLVTYTRTHFATEEKFMQQARYPDYAKHKKIHDDFTAQANELWTKVKAGKGNVTIAVMNMLKTWLTNHILNEDQAYSPYLSGVMAR